jgi:hypothetical protein
MQDVIVMSRDVPSLEGGSSFAASTVRAPMFPARAAAAFVVTRNANKIKRYLFSVLKHQASRGGKKRGNAFPLLPKQSDFGEPVELLLSDWAQSHEWIVARGYHRARGADRLFIWFLQWLLRPRRPF